MRNSYDKNNFNGTAGAEKISRVMAVPLFLRPHRIIIVVRLRSQIFRQIVQKFCRHTNVCQEISVQDDGKYASKRAAKATAANCAVLPLCCRNGKNMVELFYSK